MNIVDKIATLLDGAASVVNLTVIDLWKEQIYQNSNKYYTRIGCISVQLAFSRQYGWYNDIQCRKKTPKNKCSTKCLKTMKAQFSMNYTKVRFLFITFSTSYIFIVAMATKKSTKQKRQIKRHYTIIPVFFLSM